MKEEGRRHLKNKNKITTKKVTKSHLTGVKRIFC
jgi:hypothetical protein